MSPSWSCAQAASNVPTHQNARRAPMSSTNLFNRMIKGCSVFLLLPFPLFTALSSATVGDGVRPPFIILSYSTNHIYYSTNHIYYSTNHIYSKSTPLDDNYYKRHQFNELQDSEIGHRDEHGGIDESLPYENGRAYFHVEDLDCVQRRLGQRHAQMIAIAGTIGTGLLLG